MAELVHTERRLSDWFPGWSEVSLRTAKMDRSRKDLTKFERFLKKGQSVTKWRPCSCFLAYNFGKNLCENDIMKIVCSFTSSL